MIRWAPQGSMGAWAPLAVLALPILAPPARGDTPALPLALPNVQVDLSRLEPDATTAAPRFQVDAATGTIFVLVTASHDGVGAEIEIPGGTVVSPETIDSVGGAYERMIGGDEAGGLLMILGHQPGFHQLFELPTQGVGTYKIHLTAPPGITEEVAVVTTAILDGDLRTTLFAADPVVPLGSFVALHAALFDGPWPVSGALASVFVKAPSGAESFFSLFDNGVGTDYESGDGLYSGAFTPLEPGVYRVRSEVSGTLPGGTSFSRKAGTTFQVVEVCAALTGGVFDFGEDDDGDGLFDRLSIEADVDVVASARVSLLVTVETASGQSMVAHGQRDLPGGPGFVAAFIDASTLWDKAEDGPYLITSVQLFCHGPEGPIPTDRDLLFFGATEPYALAQFQRPPLRLIGVVGEQTIDLEPDGDQDILAITLGVEAAVEGEYSYAARLISDCGHEVTATTGSAVLPADPSTGTVTLNFDGSTIGSAGLDGPYTVVGLGIWGCGASLYRGVVTDTQSQGASEFDSFAAPRDCNGNETPDACELASSTAPDCNMNGVPDECDLSIGTSSDCNGNTMPDECDMALGIEDDTNGNQVPDGCEVNPPLPAPYPHDRAKNRYISFDPNKPANDGRSVAFRITLRALDLGSCDGNGAPCRVDTGGPNEPGDADCNICSVNGNPCIEASSDCDPDPPQSCVPSGEPCVNDRTMAGSSNIGLAWWVGPQHPTLANDVHLLVSEPFRKTSTDWPAVVHVGDCEVVPVATYGIAALDVNEDVTTAELLVSTVGRPYGSASWWADCVSALRRHCRGDLREPLCGRSGDPPCPDPEPCSLVWGLPEGVVNFDDVGAILAVVAPGPRSTPAHMTFVDIHGNGSGTPKSEEFDPPNFVANFSDIGNVLKAFSGRPYPYRDPGDCPDVSTWP